MIKAAVAAVLVGVGLCAAPVAAQPPPGKLSRIGVLWPGESPLSASRVQWLREGLSETGYIEGQNVAFDLRHGETPEKLRAIVGDLVQSRVNVIVTAGNQGAAIARQSTSVIPVVALAGDLVAAGLASSLARPGGNVTGVTILGPELSAKRLAVLKELIPDLSRVAILWNPLDRPQLKPIQQAARSLSIKLQVLEVRSREDLPQAFRAVKDGRAEALNVLPSPLLFSFHPSILEQAASHRLPAIYHWREAAEAGGLVSYGPSLAGMWRQTGRMVGKVLKGADPANLPVEQAAEFELVINLKTARALGLTVPQTILVRADKVIQ